MRLALAIFATALVALGLWLIASGFTPTAVNPTDLNPQIATAPRTTAGPIAVGTALLAGGGLFFILLLRRR